jgi:phosphatidylcholine synthase
LCSTVDRGAGILKLARDWIPLASPVAGFILGYLGLLAILDQAWELLYLYLGLALVLQSVAAWVELGRHHSETAFSTYAAHAARFATSVVVPTVALIHAGFLEEVTGWAMALLVVAAALYRLAFHLPSRDLAPTMIGLPAVWSIVAFLLHAFDATPMASVVAIGCVLVLTLVPIHWPHPFYVDRWKAASRAVTAIWIIAALVTLVRGLPADGAAKAIFLFCPAYAVVWVLTQPRTTKA